MQLIARVSNMNIGSEGFMLSEKVTFPLDDEEIDTLLENLKLGEDEPYSITSCMIVGDYTDLSLDRQLSSFDEANDLGDEIYQIETYDEDKFFAIVEVEDIDTAISDIDNYILHPGSWEEVAKELLSCRYDIPEEVWDYIDFQGYGADQINDNYYFMDTEYGILEMC